MKQTSLPRTPHARRRHRQQGFSLIELMIVMAIIGLLIGIGYPALRGAQRSGNHTSAVASLGEVARGQLSYHSQRRTYATFDQLVEAGALGDKFKGEAPEFEGYRYTVKLTPKGNGQQAGYGVNADPIEPEGFNRSGDFFYYIGTDASGIRRSEEQPATAADPALNQEQ